MVPTAPCTHIPFHRADIGEEEIAAVAEVIRSGWLTMGEQTIEFEKRFAAYVGSTYAIAVSSCTAALHLCLESIGLQRDDEVLLPTNTFTSTAEVVTYLGARPVLVDIDPKTLNIDVTDASRRLSARTRAIIPVHIAGQPCDMARLHSFARKYDLRVIEDAAHALPSLYHGHMIGSVSEFTAFSFYATKTLTTGEGGMIATENAEAADRMRMMRLHGIGRDAWKRYTAKGSWYYEVQNAGYKYNLTDLEAAIGLVQLRKCDTMRNARRRIAERYSNAFKQIESLEAPVEIPDQESSWHLYILRLHPEKLEISRNQFVQALAAHGIGTSVHFIPLHLHPYYQNTFGYRAGDFPVAENEYERCISLPIFPCMKDSDIEHVISTVVKLVEDNSHRSLILRHARPKFQRTCQ